MTTKDHIVQPYTFWQRRLIAQRLYIDLIKQGVFNHDMTRACDRLIQIVPKAAIEALCNAR